MSTNKQRQVPAKGTRHRALTVVGVVLCIILIPVLAINITLIVKSYIHDEEVPSVGGYLTMIVMTDSMYPQIHSGDLIICRTTDAQTVKKGDVIAFFDPAGNGSSVVTHRVVKVVKKDGALSFRTRGDANNTADAELVPAENLVGTYVKRIPGAGNAAMFLQTVPGLIVCVILPLILLIGYDFIRRRRYEKKKAQDTDALLAELQALREEKSSPPPGKSGPENRASGRKS